MNLKHFQFIICVAEEKSFTKASQVLNVAQPYLSQYISNIEQQMGIVIFDRSVTPIHLTAAGEIFYTKAKEILRVYQDMNLELDDLKGLRIGEIVVGVSQIGATFIPKILPTFHKKFPHIQVKIKECSAVKEIETLIINGNINIGIIPLLGSSQNLDYQIIQQKRMMLALPIHHPIVKKSKKRSDEIYPYLSLSSLKEDWFVLPEKEQLAHLLLDKPFEEAGFSPNILCNTKTMDVANAIVASGLGICFTLPEMLRDEYKDKIALFYMEEKYTVRNVALTYRKERYLSKIEQEFITLSKKIFQTK